MSAVRASRLAALSALWFPLMGACHELKEADSGDGSAGEGDGTLTDCGEGIFVDSSIDCILKFGQSPVEALQRRFCCLIARHRHILCPQINNSFDSRALTDQRLSAAQTGRQILLPIRRNSFGENPVCSTFRAAGSGFPHCTNWAPAAFARRIT